MNLDIPNKAGVREQSDQTHHNFCMFLGEQWLLYIVIYVKYALTYIKIRLKDRKCFIHLLHLYSIPITLPYMSEWNIYLWIYNEYIYINIYEYNYESYFYPNIHDHCHYYDICETYIYYIIFFCIHKYSILFNLHNSTMK